jgi:hypothetical protein
VGIHQDLAGIKTVTLLWIEGAVDSKSVFQIFKVKPEDDHAEHVADPVMTWKGKFGKGFSGTLAKQYECAPLSS